MNNYLIYTDSDGFVKRYNNKKIKETRCNKSRF